MTEDKIREQVGEDKDKKGRSDDRPGNDESLFHRIFFVKLNSAFLRHQSHWAASESNGKPLFSTQREFLQKEEKTAIASGDEF
jgi:hypothetical protein